MLDSSYSQRYSSSGRKLL